MLSDSEELRECPLPVVIGAGEVGDGWSVVGLYTLRGGRGGGAGSSDPDDAGSAGVNKPGLTPPFATTIAVRSWMGVKCE